LSKLNSPPTAQPGLFYGYAIVIIGVVMMVVSWGSYYSFGVFFNPLLDEFHWTRAMTAGAFSLAAIVQGAAGIAAGGLNDRYGPRVLMAVSGILLGISYICMSQVTEIWQLYIFYGLFNGIGMAGPVNTIIPTVAHWFTKRRGVMAGIVMAGIGLGAVIVPFLANYLITITRWQTAYLYVGITIMVIILVLSRFLFKDPAVKGQLALGAGESVKSAVATNPVSLSFSQAAKTIQFWLVAGMMVCYGYVLFTIMVHIVPHARDMLITADRAALIITTIGISSIIGKIVMGYVTDSIGARKAFLISFIMMGAALFSLLALTEYLSLIHI